MHLDTAILAEGKTKIVREYPDDHGLAIIESKDDITAGDGAKHDVIHGKAELATRTTSNVFHLLSECGVPTAFRRRLSGRAFLADRCDMLPLEVVVRREAHGSFLKRYPHFTKGHVFPQLIVEFFLKTSGKKWRGIELPKDDPFIQFQGEEARLFRPDTPFHGQTPFHTLPATEIAAEENLLTMAEMARFSFLVLEKAFQLLGPRLVDMKDEFGLNQQGKLTLADVLDNDSWRLVDHGGYLDKQVYRDGGPLTEVTALYRHVADLTDRFGIPRQQIVIWRGSERDNVEPFLDMLKKWDFPISPAVHTASLHKEPVKSAASLTLLLQHIPDSVVIAYVGRSNGAGPTLSANATIPVITVPASWKEFPDDIWSSLRTPSDVPAMTVLTPENAVLAAAQILAMRNPAVYAKLRMKQEKRFTNFVTF